MHRVDVIASLPLRLSSLSSPCLNLQSLSLSVSVLSLLNIVSLLYVENETSLSLSQD